MSSKEDKTQAAERIKAQTLTATKGMSRAQAERAHANATRNVNAYGQKEEGPSRWQERKEAKRQMYLMSTEKAVILGQRKDKAPAVAGGAAQCQKCYAPGHWTYECKNERVYVSRPSRSQVLKNPKLLKTSTSAATPSLQNPDIEEEEMRAKASKPKSKGGEKSSRSKSKRRKHRSGSDSDGNVSQASVFDSDDSESSATGTDGSESSSSYSSSESEDRRRRKRKQKKRRHARARRTSSSESSESESASDSDSEDNKSSRKKSKRRSHSHRH